MGSLKEVGGRGCGAICHWQVGVEGNGERWSALSGISSGSHGQHPPGLLNRSTLGALSSMKWRSKMWSLGV